MWRDVACAFWLLSTPKRDGMIDLKCECGRRFQTSDGNQGSVFRCPFCARTIHVRADAQSKGTVRHKNRRYASCLRWGLGILLLAQLLAVLFLCVYAEVSKDFPEERRLRAPIRAFWDDLISGALTTEKIRYHTAKTRELQYEINDWIDRMRIKWDNRRKESVSGWILTFGSYLCTFRPPERVGTTTSVLPGVILYSFLTVFGIVLCLLPYYLGARAPR